MESALDNGGSERSSSSAQSVLQTAQVLYPVVLLLTFIISAGIHTVVTSKTEEELASPTVTGPGGKPLPITKRRRRHQASQIDDDASSSDGGGVAWSVFLYLTAAIVVSFVANGAAAAVHAMKSSRDAGFTNAWWCGEQRIVCFCPPPSWSLVLPSRSPS